MHILNDGRTLIIGDDELVGLAFTLPQWLTLFVLIAFIIPFAGLLAIDPAALHNPMAILLTLSATGGMLAVVVVIRHTLLLVAGSQDIVSATFDLDHETLELIFIGLFGLTSQTIPISDVRTIRLGRGDWNGVKVSEISIIDLEHGRSIILPTRLTPKELTLLKVLTGLRS